MIFHDLTEEELEMIKKVIEQYKEACEYLGVTATLEGLRKTLGE